MTAWRRLRRSLTTRITLSIALVALLLVGACGALIDHLVADELADQSELRLLTAMTFLSEDLSHPNGLPAMQARLDALQLRERIRARVVDAAGRTLNTPLAIDLPDERLPVALDASRLPADAALQPLRDVRAAAPASFAEWTDGAGREWRLLRGRAMLAEGPADILVATEQTKTAEVRRGEFARLGLALGLTAIVATALGILIARTLLADARRMGETAARIGAQALRERLSPEDVPVELEASARAFNLMLDRLEAAFDRLSRFSAEVAHDLRTPIGNLLGEAQVALSRARSPDEYRAVLESAVEEYERMSRMIGNMLFLARADNAQTVLDLQPVSIDELLRRVVAYFEYVAEDAQVALRTQVEPAESTLRCDAALVTRALGNLVANALRFATPGSAVTLRAVASRDAVELSVANLGPAIAAEHRARIFERFYRIDAARQGSESGSGLGLAIVRSVMDLHCGTAEVAGERGTTVFSLRFPSA